MSDEHATTPAAPSNERKVAVPIKRSPWFYVILAFGIIAIISIIVSIAVIKPSSKNKDLQTATTVIKAGVSIPDSYKKPYTLKKGETIKVDVPLSYENGEPVFYDYECSGGGKIYCHQAQNCKKDTVGGGIPYTRPSERAAYFELSPYNDEEITVVCTFTKIKS